MPTFEREIEMNVSEKNVFANGPAAKAIRSSLVIGHWSLVILFLSGCTSLDLSSKLPWSNPEKKIKEEKYQRPVRMVAIWSPTTISAPGKPSTRGLGGRLY